MNRPIPRHNVNLSSEELKLVMAGAIGRGEHASGRERFEAAAARYFGVPHAIAVESGRTALHLALLGLDLPDNATVVLPSYCFFSLVKVVEGMGYAAVRTRRSRPSRCVPKAWWTTCPAPTPWW